MSPWIQNGPLVGDRCPLGYLLENMVYSNIEIPQMRPVPISPKHLFKQKVASGTGGYLVCINKENSPMKTALSFFAFLLQILMK